MMISTVDVGCFEIKKSVSAYKWTIHNFSSFKQPTGKCIRSQVILAANCSKLAIYLFPNGHTKDSKEFLSVCLSVSTVVESCEITATSSTKVYETHMFNPVSPDSLIEKFVHRETILADIKKDNDELTLVVKIVFSSTPIEKNYFNLIKDVALLSTKKEHADVILVSSDKSKQKAHKAILACRSKVFSAMFQRNMNKVQDNTIDIKDVDNETLKVMLDFIYTGHFQACLDQDDVKKLLVAAVKYELNDLTRICIEIININSNNVLDLIQFANTHNISDLKVKAKEYFLQNRKIILLDKRNENLKDLSRDILEDLLCDLASA